jgi:hypothetical protein
MNLKKILDTALLVNDPAAYAQGREEKRRRALEEADSIARQQLMRSQAEAGLGRVENSSQSNITRLLSTLKSGKYTPQQIEDIASSLPEDQQVVLRQGLAGHQPVVDAGLGLTGARTRGADATTKKTEGETLTPRERYLRGMKAAADIANQNASAREKDAHARTAGAGKAPDPDRQAARIEDQIYQAQRDLEAGNISPKVFRERLDQLNARAERAKSGSANPARAATVAGVGRGQPKKPADPLPEPAKAPEGPRLKFGGRIWTPKDVQSGELVKQRDALRAIAAKRPEVRSQLIASLRSLGIGNPEEFLGR